MELRLEQPWLLVLLLLPLLVLWLRPRRGGAAFPGMALAGALRASRGPALYRLLIAGALALLVVAAARPQWGRNIIERTQSGRDLALVIDLSGSMQVDDIVDTDGKSEDRLAAVIAAAKSFVEKRPDDRVALVFFSSRAITACPPTFDHETIRQFLERMERQQRAIWKSGDERGLLGGETNLGLGLATALRCLREKIAPGRAVILITDGADSPDMHGWVDPLVAARTALASGIAVHGIGVGAPQGYMNGHTPFGQVVRTRVPRHLLPDLGRLKAITTAASGQAFAATDGKGLDEVFSAIDKLEPSHSQVRQSEDFSDRFRWPLILGLALAGFALVLEPRLRGVA